MKLRIFFLFFIVASLVFCLVFPVLRYLNLNTSYWDLGVFDHFLYIFSSNGNWYWFVKNHFSPVLFFYGFLYKIISPSPVLLIIVQYLVVCSGGVIVYLFAKKSLNKTWGLFFIFVYLLHPMVNYHIFWDFHPDHLAIPIILAFFYLLYCSSYSKKTTNILIFILMVILCSVKETMIFSAIFIGLFLVFNKERRILGVAIIVMSSAVYFVASDYIGFNFHKYSNVYLNTLPINEKSLFPSFYQDWGNSYGELVVNVLTSPWKLLTFIFANKDKVLFIVISLLPFGSFLFRVPKMLLPLIPPFAIVLLSLKGEKYAIVHHYHAAIIPVMFAASIVGLAKIKEKVIDSKKVIAFGICMTFAATMASPLPWGIHFWFKKRYGYENYISNDRNKKIKNLIHQYIPDDFNTPVGINNMFNYSYLVQRKHVELFPWSQKPVDYLVLDYKEMPRHKKTARRFIENCRKIVEYDGFYILDTRVCFKVLNTEKVDKR